MIEFISTQQARILGAEAERNEREPARTTNILVDNRKLVLRERLGALPRDQKRVVMEQIRGALPAKSLSTIREQAYAKDEEEEPEEDLG